MSERDLFLAARGLVDPAARAAFLETACAGNPALRARVERLLRADTQGDSMLDTPVVRPWEQDQTTSQLVPTDLPQFPFLTPPGRPDSLGRLGHYEVLEVLGQGGFGIVFRAVDEVLERVVAVKVLAPHLAATSPARKRFLREARSSARVRHENVVQVHAVEEQPIPYLVMEFIPGETLQQRLHRTGPLEPAEVARVGRQIAEGLAAAHEQGLIHRDVTPGNVLIERGPHEHVKLTDFGLARSADDACLTQSGVVAGTPNYMSPEQARGDAVDARSDLFSLGSVLYAITSGRPPFRAANNLAVLKRVREDNPRPIPEVIPETPRWLCDVIAKLQAKRPEDRHQSAREVADRLARHQADGPVVAPARPAPARPTRRRFGRYWSVAAVVAMLAVGLGMTEATGVTKVRGTIVRMMTPHGTLVIETDDPDVRVTVDGEEVAIAGAGVKELRVKPGPHTVEARADGEFYRQDLVTVTRDGRQVVRVSREGPPAAKPPAIPPAKKAPADLVAADPDRKAAEWVRTFNRGPIEVWVNGHLRCIEPHDPLPEGPLRLNGVHLHGDAVNRLGDDLPDRMAEGLRGVRLEALHTSSSGLTAAGLEKLVRLPALAGLTRLGLTSAPVDEGVFAHLARLPDLTDLSLDQMDRVTGKGIRALKACPKLCLVTFLTCPVSPEAIAEMGALPALDYLNLSALRLTDDHAAAIARLKVGKLVLGSTGLDDGMAARLGGMTGLRELMVAGNPLTDACLPTLASLKGLKELNLGATKVTPAGLASLRKALPECKVTNE